MNKKLPVYQIEHTQPDIFVRGTHCENCRSDQETFRPYFSLCFEIESRFVVSWTLRTEVPSSDVETMLLYKAINIQKDTDIGGIPKAIYLERASSILKKFCHNLSIDLFPYIPGHPPYKTVAERFLNKLHQQFWSTLPGYTCLANATRGENLRLLKFPQLYDALEDFLDLYHRKISPERGQTPYDLWKELYTPLPVDHLQLTQLINHEVQRCTLKNGIMYHNHIYWHEDLATFLPLRSEVTIRMFPNVCIPEQIEVFYQGKYICTAFRQQRKFTERND